MRFAVMRYWQLCDKVEVEARTRDEAIDRAHEIALEQSRGEYVSGSLNSDPEHDVELITDGTAKIPTAKFRLGKIVTTTNALSQLSQEEILLGIQRHQAGDWGDLLEHECKANDNSRSECRQTKRDVKQEGRQNGTPNTNTTTTTNPR